MAEDQEFVLPPLEERPLVTFALFAYNQEKYIREAVEGAFAQTYEPLEIILSDDCSTDRTFEIMEEMAAAYTGPHTVRVKRTPENIGTLAHVISVGKKSLGKVVVIAAGDDISIPNRVSDLSRLFEDQEVWGACSSDVIIGSDGSDLGADAKENYLWGKDQRSILRNCQFKSLHGATSAYRQVLFHLIEPPCGKVLVEDYPLSVFILALNKKIRFYHNPLVQYRWHESNISVRETIRNLNPEAVGINERRLMRRRRLVFEAMQYVEGVSRSKSPIGQALIENVDFDCFKKRAEYVDLSSRWDELNIKEKIRFFVFSFSVNDLKSALVRVFGFFVFSWSKVLHRRLVSFLGY